MKPPVTVLFLCTGNSARSIMAEAMLNHLGAGRYLAFSAGSRPAGTVNPGALAELARRAIPAGSARSKSWEEFAQDGAPALDIIITVCANAAGEACPVWPGRPATAHWGMEDPAAVPGERERDEAFSATYRLLDHRLRLLMRLPLDGLNQEKMLASLRAIGHAMPGQHDE